MNVFGDLTRPITQRPGDPRGAMSYADAMALRDRNRSGQPVDKDKLAEADRIVRGTRARMMSGPQEVQEQPEPAGDAGAPAEDVTTIHAAPDSMLAEMIAKKAAGEAAKRYHPKVGSLPWKLYRYLQKHPHKAMTRNEIAAAFECPANGLDTVMELAVSRQAMVKARNSKMELTWALGPSKNVVMDEGDWTDPDFSKEAGAIIPRFGRIDPPLKLVPPAPLESAPVLADASISEHGSTTSEVSTPPSTPEESITPTAVQPPESDSVAAQLCAESLASRASAAPPGPQPHDPVAPAQPESEASVAPTRLQSEVAVAPAQQQDGPEALHTMEMAADPVQLGLAMKRDLWNDRRALEKRWVAFFDGFEPGDYVDLEEWAAPEVVAWRSFYEEKSWDYSDGVHLFTIFKKDDRQGDGEYRMVRVL